MSFAFYLLFPCFVLHTDFCTARLARLDVGLALNLHLLITDLVL